MVFYEKSMRIPTNHKKDHREYLAVDWSHPASTRRCASSFRACVFLVVGALPSALIFQMGCSRSTSPFTNTRALSPVELFQRVSPSVFVVEGLDQNGKTLILGSGVAMAPDFLITNCHVAQSASSLRISRGKEKWAARLIQAVPEHDLCGLRPKADTRITTALDDGRVIFTNEDSPAGRPSGLSLSPVNVRPSSDLATGEPVYAIGAPEGLELTFSEGVISALRETEGVHLIQTSAPTSPGSSGGGLFDAHGNLIGITTFQLKEGQSLNFALPGEWVRTSLNSLTEAPRKSSPPPSDVELESRAWLRIGLEAMKKEDYDLAGHSLRKCADLKQSDASKALLELGHIAEMAAGLNSPSDAFKSWLRQFRLSQEEAQSRAIADFEKAIEIKADYTEAWLELARVHELLRKEYDQAIYAAKEAARLSPGDWNTWFVLGNSYYDRASYSDAIGALQRAEKVAPDKMKSTVLLDEGRAYDRMKDRDQVLRIYQELKASDPGSAEYFFKEYVLPRPDQHPSKQRSKRNTDNDVIRVLDNASTNAEIKLAAWHALHAAVNGDDFKRRFDAIALPDEVKAELWDLKFGSLTPAGNPFRGEELQ
jgi:S1-C subfamily serine protease